MVLKKSALGSSEGAWGFNPTNKPPQINRGFDPGLSFRGPRRTWENGTAGTGEVRILRRIPLSRFASGKYREVNNIARDPPGVLDGTCVVLASPREPLDFQ